MENVSRNETPEPPARKPLGANEGDINTVITDGFLGFGLSACNAILAIFYSAYNMGSALIASLTITSVAFFIAAFLFVGKSFADLFAEDSRRWVLYGAYSATFACSVICEAARLSLAADILAGASFAATLLLYGKYLSSLDRKVLMLLVSAVFIVAGFTIVVLLPLERWYSFGIVGVLIAFSMVMTFLFCRKDLPLNEFCDKSESKRRSVKVKGNNHTLVLLGFMLGACVMVCSIEQPRDFLVLGVGGAVGIAGILFLLLAQLEERAYKEMLKKTCAFATAACFLLLGIVPPLAQLVLLGAYLCFVFLNVIVLVNAIIETARFNLMSPLWLLGHEGAIFFLGMGAGCALYTAGIRAAQTWPLAFQISVILGVIVCAWMQISVNYQAYPFEPVIEGSSEEKMKAQELTERNGHRKSLYQKKRELACELYALSPREREILATLLKGRDAKYIMDTFYISQSTAKTHIYNIYRKFDVHSRQDLLDFIEDIELPPEELADALPDDEC